MIKAAMVTPNLTLGGAERWLVDLVKHSDPSRVVWTGVAVSSFGGADEHLATELAKHTRLVANKSVNRPAHAKPFFWPAMHEITSPDFRDTVTKACRGADVVLTWGSPDMGYWFDGFKMPRVTCSHTTLQENAARPITGITHLTAVSEVAMCFFDGRDGSKGLPRHVIYNGADPGRLVPSKPREQIRAGWKLGPKDVAIGYLGRQSEEKNPLAPAMAVSVSPKWYHAIYYGFGPSGTDFCEKTRRWCERNIPGRFQMHRPTPQVGNVLQGLDVLVLASHREAFSLTLIEAWMSGVPVVATPVGSIPELEAKYDKLVFRVPIKPHAEELSLAADLALTPILRDRVRSRAYKLAQEQFTIRAMVDRWMDYLEAVARGEL